MKIQPLVFVSKYLQFKHYDTGASLYLSPEFMCRNQKPTQTNDSWFISSILTRKPEFSTPKCPVRALRCCHYTIVESHATLRDSKSRPKTIKVHEVCYLSTRPLRFMKCATSVQLFSKVDLQTVLKAGRWLSGETSFSLQDLGSQTDQLHKGWTLVSGGTDSASHLSLLGES